MFKIIYLAAIAVFSIVSCTKAQETKSFAVIELYTSEGCSSCPAAEELMPELKKQYGNKLHVFEYHVDYWNRLGWNDVYSKKEFSERQRDYTRIFKSNTVFTPQAIINGQVSAVGSDRIALEEAIDSLLKIEQPNTHISLKATLHEEVVKVKFKTNLEAQEHLQLALVLRETATQVKAGENIGRVLHHNDVVIELKTIFYEEGEVLFTLPSALWAKNCYIAAYIQRSDNMHVEGIKMTDIL